MVSGDVNVEFWKAFLMVMSVVTLPFALVAVGQAQGMTCWGLRASLSETSGPADCSVRCPCRKREDVAEEGNSAWSCRVIAEDGKSVG